jgi:cation diffusion facilitator family transporter
MTQEDNIYRYHQTRKATLIGAVANTILAVAKVLFGLLGHSSALIADGIHSFSDLLTDILVIVAAKFAHHEADDDHPYGHERIETAATVALAMFLILVSLAIVYNPIHAFWTHVTPIKPDSYVMWIAVVSVLVNEGIYRYTAAVAKRIKSDMLHANALHSRSDAASSFVVLIGVGGSLMGFAWLDGAAAIVVGLMILKMGVSIGWKSISELVDTGVDEETLQKIRTQILSVPSVEEIHQLRTRQMAGKIFLDVHIIVPSRISVSEGHHIGDSVLTGLYNNVANVCDVTVHVDSEDDELYSENASLPSREVLLPQLQTAWQGLPGAEHIQDVVLHYTAGKIELEIKFPIEALEERAHLHAWRQQYQQALKSLPHIEQVTLIYQ